MSGGLYVCEKRFKSQNPSFVQAVFRDDLDAIRVMLQQDNVDPNSRDQKGDTALHMLFQSINEPSRQVRGILSLLIDAYVDVRLPNAAGQEPIMFAQRVESYTRKMQYMGELILHGADLNIRIKNDNPNSVLIKNDTMSVLDQIVQTHGLPVVELFLNYWGWLITDDTLKNGLRWSRTLIFTDIEALLMRKPTYPVDLKTVDPEWIDPHTGFTPLIMAILKGDLELINTVLKKNRADINKPSQNEFDGTAHYEYTPLMVAVLKRDYSLVEYLLKAGADPLRQSRNGNSVLHMVMYIDHKESRDNRMLMERLLFLLIDNKANINARNKKEETFLHIAVRKNAQELIRSLLEKYGKKLDPVVKASLIKLAQSLKYREIEKMLLDLKL